MIKCSSELNTLQKIRSLPAIFFCPFFTFSKNKCYAFIFQICMKDFRCSISCPSYQHTKLNLQNCICPSLVSHSWIFRSVTALWFNNFSCLAYNLVMFSSSIKRPSVFVDVSRETANAEKVKEAHKRVMVANHPDAGGSHYLASKINEAKDVLSGKTKGGGSAFWFENEECILH